jgi:ThiF family protein
MTEDGETWAVPPLHRQDITGGEVPPEARSMMYRITFSLPLFRHVLSTLHQHPAAPVRWPVGLSQWAGHGELLATAQESTVARHLLIGWTDRLAVPQPFPPGCVGLLLVGRHQQRGHVRGIVGLPDHARTSAHALHLVGPGMLTVPLQQTQTPGQELHREAGASLARTERWSRTIGALGLEVWQRLVGLRYALIGLGRTGSRVALALTHLGVRHLTLIDPDRLEVHNLGEMVSVTAADLGRLKVEAVAAGLRAMAAPEADRLLVPTSMTQWQALHAAQACDVLITCVDHDGARLAAQAVATLFCKPLLDIATGVHRDDGERQLGPACASVQKPTVWK